MIKYTQGDILKSDSEALVNTVNLVGVMGKGLALQFKKAYPEMFAEYWDRCKKGAFKPGTLHIYALKEEYQPKYIVNFPTKRHFRNKSNIKDIEAGLTELRRFLEESKINSVSIPPLGCGLGGLDWAEVRRLIEKKLAGLDNITITVFEPFAK